MKGMRWVALVLVCVIGGAAIYMFAPWLAALLGVGALYGLVRYGMDACPRRDPYSIQALQDLAEREELHKLLEGEPGLAEDAVAICPSCHGLVDPKRRVCRGCGRPF